MSNTGTAAVPLGRPREILSARHVQSRLRPRRRPETRTLDYTGCCLPGRSVGGDFYDFLEAGPGRIALLLGDVCGKGVPAALMMAALQASLRSSYALSRPSLERRIEIVNRLFYDCTADEHYATLFAAEYDEATGRLRYVNCGHCPPLLADEAGRVKRLEPTGTVVGMFEKWNGAAREIVLDPGDTLVVVSDGIVEAASYGGEEFGEAGLTAAVVRGRHMSPEFLAREIGREVRDFSGRLTVDDQTLLVARRNGNG